MIILIKKDEKQVKTQIKTSQNKVDIDSKICEKNKKSFSEKDKLVISFSGGRTSAYMLLHCLEYMSEHETVIAFANTGCEHEETLVFVDKMDKLIGNKIIWLEAVVNQEQGKGIRHRVVNFETAARNGEPFEDAISKYGIFNTSYPNCTGRLKTEVIDSYLRDIGWPVGIKSRQHKMAIGIRWDEVHRMNKTAQDAGIIYPLIDAKINKETIIDFWRNQPFDLSLKGEHYGNCVWCWKKSLRKLMTLAKDDPANFNFPKRMEAKYSMVKSKDPGGRQFFRENKTSDDIIGLSKYPFNEYSDNMIQGDLFGCSWDEVLDIESSCGESCEIGTGSASDFQ